MGALSGLSKLEALALSGDGGADLWTRWAMPPRRYLASTGNAATDAGPLAVLADLGVPVRLDPGGNEVADATPLGDVERLVRVRPLGNRLTALDGLGRLTRLCWAWLESHPVASETVLPWSWPKRSWVDLRAEVPR